MKISNNFCSSNCPVCGSELIERQGDINYSNPIYFSSVTINLEYQPSLWKCGICESGFTQNSINETDLRKLYTESDSGTRWSRVTFEENKPPEVIKLLKSIFLNGTTLADIGCNTGELLDFAKEHSVKTIGVELSNASRSIVEGKGHKSFTSLDQIEDDSLDIITAFDLIEHLHDPNQFISLSEKKLKQKGKLILLTGNINSLSSKLSRARWWYCSYPEHLSFISKKYLETNKFLKLIDALPTYASKGYKHSIFRVAINFLIKYPLKKYKGLPSMGPDHFLYVLEKDK